MHFAEPKCAELQPKTETEENQCISDAKPKCAQPRPNAIQCSKLKTQSIQMQCQLQFSAAAVQKKPIHDAAIFCRTRFTK